MRRPLPLTLIVTLLLLTTGCDGDGEPLVDASAGTGGAPGSDLTTAALDIDVEVSIAGEVTPMVAGVVVPATDADCEPTAQRALRLSGEPVGCATNYGVGCPPGVYIKIEVDGAAALMRPPGQIPPFWLDFEHPPDEPPAFELYVRQLGPGPGAAQRMVKRSQDWDRAGRPQP